MVAAMSSNRSAAVRFRHRVWNAVSLNSLEEWHAVHEPKNAIRPPWACSAGTTTAVVGATGESAVALASGAAGAGSAAGAGDEEQADTRTRDSTDKIFLGMGMTGIVEMMCLGT